MTRTKDFDCVEVKRRSQRELVKALSGHSSKAKSANNATAPIPMNTPSCRVRIVDGGSPANIMVGNITLLVRAIGVFCPAVLGGRLVMEAIIPSIVASIRR